jgi:4-amino-4-deoxy-L-arabinose transferase-like glycosyltransferase
MFAFVHERALGWLAVVIAIATLFCRLGVLPLLAPDEGRNAEVAREMNESGAWLVPTYNGADYLDKPAFYFKTVALSLAMFGNSEAVARLPSAAAAAALVVMVFAFCRKIHGTRCALLAVTVVASTPLFVANARTVILDMMLALFVCGAIFAGYLAELSEGSARRYWYLAGAASTGVATLIKGPIGILIPALVLLVFNALEGRAGAWKRLLSPLNILVVLGIALPWFIGLCLRHPDFFQYGLVEESFKRFTVAKRFHRSEPFYFYVPIVGALFLPWSLLFPGAMMVTWKQRGLRHSADRLCLVWAVLVVVFFSLSQSKLPGYILSVTVACGILMGRILDAALATPEGGAGRLVRRATAAFSTVCFMATMIVLFGGSSLMRSLARPLRIPVEEAKGLFHGAVPLLVVAAVFGGLGLFAFLRRSIPLCFLCLAVFPPVFGHTSFALFSVIFEAKSAHHLARDLSKLPATTDLACLECFPSGLPFYLGHTLTLFSKGGGELTSNYIIYSIEKTGKWPVNLSPVTGLDHWLESRKRPMYLIGPPTRLEKLTAIALAAGGKIEPLPAGFLGVQLPSKGEH